MEAELKNLKEKLAKTKYFIIYLYFIIIFIVIKSDFFFIIIFFYNRLVTFNSNAIEVITKNEFLYLGSKTLFFSLTAEFICFSCFWHPVVESCIVLLKCTIVGSLSGGGLSASNHMDVGMDKMNNCLSVLNTFKKKLKCERKHIWKYIFYLFKSNVKHLDDLGCAPVCGVLRVSNKRKWLKWSVFWLFNKLCPFLRLPILSSQIVQFRVKLTLSKR